jgi:hypothetical protein
MPNQPNFRAHADANGWPGGGPQVAIAAGFRPSHRHHEVLHSFGASRIEKSLADGRIVLLMFRQ